MRTRTVVLTIAGVCVVALAAGVIVAQRLEAATKDERDCTDQLQVDVSAVRTAREWTSEDIPGVGDYVEIHWQADTPGSPCSRAPGPTDWQYEGVLRLRDTDTAAFAAWPAATGAPSVRDALRSFVPAGVHWRHGGGFPQSVHGRVVDLYVDPDLAVAWFSLADS
ncbi:hypothetical protein AB0K00_45955 [Dactylosporangium sp. NPDC049525]|uniref:hypothetical protein n=1 Tax=Dactylosporangium sp. NPDC049525 TaxID=3154730 RepID=UPI003441469D